MESILTSIKKMLGISEEYIHFDTDIIIHINSTFRVLHQLGVGPSKAFRITNSDAIWTDFIDVDCEGFDEVKTYVYQRVKLIFDPPLSSAHLAALKESIAEFEWRLQAEAEFHESVETDEDSPDYIIPDDSTGETVQGVTDYRKLSNLPKINGTTLIDNYNEKDPTVNEMTEDDVNTIWNQIFSES